MTFQLTKCLALRWQSKSSLETQVSAGFCWQGKQTTHVKKWRNSNQRFCLVMLIIFLQKWYNSLFGGGGVALTLLTQYSGTLYTQWCVEIGFLFQSAQGDSFTTVTHSPATVTVSQCNSMQLFPHVGAHPHPKTFLFNSSGRNSCSDGAL